jgi:hypothetical protein
MKFYLLALGLLALAIPARADTITPKGFSAEFINPTGSLSESFQTSFEWDRTTQDIVPGSMQVSSSGPLGAFTFTESIVRHTISTNPMSSFTDSYFYSFFWTNQTGDVINSAVVNNFGPMTSHWLPFFNFTGPDVNAGWTTEDHPGLIGFFRDSPVPAPEPASLFLLGLGMATVVIVSKKLLVSRQ